MNRKKDKKKIFVKNIIKVGRRVDKLKLKKTEYALFPSVIHQVNYLFI